MEGIYGWVRNIVYYLIFMTIIINLLPAGKYEKYLRLFAGCILILLVIKPLTGGLRMEEKINAIFRTVTFENEAGELRGELDEMEQKRLNRLIGQYEESAGEELIRLAGEEGIEAAEAIVVIEEDSASPDFGTVKKIVLKLEKRAGEDSKTEKESEMQESGSDSMENGITLEEVEKVSVRLEGSGGRGASEAAGRASARQQSREAEKIREFRHTIAGYYQMEEENVEIRLED